MFDCKSAILSVIHKRRFNVITKEEYELMYETDKKSDEREDLSVGEGLETFVEKIKNGRVNENTIPIDGALSRTFLLSLLSEEESNKLEQLDPGFMRTFTMHADTSWRVNPDIQEYINSDCKCRTYFINV